MEVEGHGNGLRLLLLFHLFQDVQKAVDGMGIETLPGGQGPDAEKRPVDDGVTV